VIYTTGINVHLLTIKGHLDGVLIFHNNTYFCLCKDERALNEICNIWGIWGTLIQRCAYL